MPFSPGPASSIRGLKSALALSTRGGSRVPELGTLGSVRGALSNERPYRDLRNDGPKYRFEMSRGFSSDSAESGYQRLFAHQLQKSDMHPTPWLACDCMPGMKDSKLVSAHDFWKSEREPSSAARRGTISRSSDFSRALVPS